MPTYHYRCSDCGHAFDQYQKFADDPLTECPECGGPIRRVPQPVGIVFKGSGWYVNDSRKQNGKESESSSKKKPDESSDKAATESKSKADDSAPAKTEKSEAKASS